MKITLLTLASCLVCALAFAGPNPVVVPENQTTLLEELGQTLFAARAASLAVYPSYDPYITVGGVKHPYGFGVALLYPVSEYAFAGLRLDYLGNSFTAPSAVIGAKYTLKNFPFTPTVFTVGGIIVPTSGAGDQNKVADAVAGLGASATLWHDAAGRFSVNAFIEGEKWTNFKGVILHPGVAASIKF